MPFLKTPKPRQPKWKCSDELAQKKGFLHTIYSVNGDEYTGEWLNNLKHGKGTYKWKATGCLYDGDWKEDMRNGFGTYSVPTPNGGYIKEYSGGWKDNKKHGFGTHYYSENSSYEGEWYCGKRNGWGRMTYPDCSVYEGEWYDSKRHGQGMLRLSNGNRYEGSWQNGKKNGPGSFYYLNKGQVYEGVWLDDLARCGQMKDLSRDTAPDATPYPIPPNSLADPDKVLEEAEATFTIAEV
jgi:hypothetical protein